MKKIIEKLQNQIKDSDKFGDDVDEASWNYQIGVIISRREAKAIVAYFKEKEMKDRK